MEYWLKTNPSLRIKFCLTFCIDIIGCNRMIYFGFCNNPVLDDIFRYHPTKCEIWHKIMIGRDLKGSGFDVNVYIKMGTRDGVWRVIYIWRLNFDTIFCIVFLLRILTNSYLPLIDVEQTCVLLHGIATRSLFMQMGYLENLNLPKREGKFRVC
jgi:hypothetical protein